MPEPPPWRFDRIIKPVFDIPSPHRVFKGGRVLTCVGDEIIENGFVEIEDGKIKTVGEASQLGSTDAEVIDCSGKTLMPGMIDSHAHLGWDGVHPLAHQGIYDTPEISAYKVASNMLKNLLAGVTVVRDLGMNDTNLVAKQAIEQGIFPGPRLLACGRAIVQTGGHTYWCCREASGPDEMRRAVREQVRGGADLIKIMGSHDRIEFTDAELEAVIDESHRNGLLITAHATFNDVIHRVAEFGVDCIEHGGSMSDETIQLLLDRKLPIVTTFAPLVMQAQEEIAREYGMPDWLIQSRVRTMKNPERFNDIVKAAKAGVAIVFGTDKGSPVVGHEVVAPEMKFMVKLGVVEDNYAALRSATSVSSKAHQLGDKLGTLEAGKEADLLVINGNPVADLDALERIEMTFIAGKRMIMIG